MRPALALVVAVAALGGAVGVADGIGTPATQRPVARGGAVAPVVGARVVCPDAVDRTVGHISRRTRIGVAVPRSAATAVAGGGGSVTATKVGANNPAHHVLSTTDHVAVIAAQPYLSDVVLAGTGMLAPGLAADELGRRDGGTYRGLDSVACTAPRDSAWLIGADTNVGAHAELRLTNTDDTAALVDIGLFNRSGVVNARNAVGVTVNPNSTRVIPLETLAPGSSLLMLHLVTTTGRVAVALRQQLQSASTPLGNDWVALAQAPSRYAVVPGLPPGGGPRTVLLGNPGDIDATATVRLIRGDSSFVPRGLSAITVPAGSTLAVDVTKALAAKTASVLVTSDHPIVAGASISTGPRVSGFAEQAFSASTPALTGPTGVLVNYVPTFGAHVVLTAPSGAATVLVKRLGTTQTATVRVPAGRSVVYDLAGIARGQTLVAVTLTPTPGSGPVYAAREEFERAAHGPMYTVLPLQTAPQFAVVPATGLDPRAGLPR
jgi:hypothetical protein